MASDREVLREVWEGKLPVCFTLAAEDVHGLQAPDKFYLMVPRLSYFPLVTDKVRRHFIRHIDPEKQDAEMWLEFNSQPIKWHYPVGVLFDVLMANEVQLPWSLTVHFEKFPESEIMHCNSKEVVESHFMSCIKEADVLKHKSHVASSMQKKEHNQLWLGLQNDKLDQFWSVNRRLMETADPEGFKYIPFRCHRGDELSPPLQRLCKPVDESGQPRTLGDLINELFPDANQKSIRVVTHGVEPPWDTPLQWLSEHMSYPDNFLHLSVHTKV